MLVRAIKKGVFGRKGKCTFERIHKAERHDNNKALFVTLDAPHESIEEKENCDFEGLDEN